MIILAVLCLLFLALAILASMIAFKEREKNIYIRQDLAGEFEQISNAMNKVSMGLLNQHLPKSKANLPDIIKNGMDTLRTSFNKITCDPLNRVCYVGTDSWFEGIACAKYVGNRLHEGGRIIIIVTSSLDAFVMAQRHRSFTNTIKKDFTQVKIVETFEAHANQDLAAGYVRTMADKIDGIYITGNSLVPGVVRGLEESGAENNVFVLCHDLDKAIVENMRKGLVSASVVCSPYLQAKDALIHLYNHVATGWKPFQPRLMQTLHTVIADDLNDFWDEANSCPKKNLSEKQVTPMKTTILKHRRLLVLAEDWNDSFVQMIEGANDSANVLKDWDCDVVIHVLNQLKNPERQVLAEARAVIMQEKELGLDGIAAFVGVAGMVDLLNTISVQGIPVVSFNSEPLSLRSMIEWLVLSSSQLALFTRQYQAGIMKIESTQKNIYSNLEAVVTRSQKQIDAIGESSINANEFSGYVQESAQNETEQTSAIEQTTQISSQLEQIVQSFDENVKRITQMGEQVRISASKTNTIKEFSEKIGSILTMIDAISGQTNLLAFNAAVESTHAGEFGEGFKVISQEIRALADQSTKSTANIAKLIEDMRKAVAEGIGANNSALATVTEEVDSITNIAKQLNELSATLLSSVNKVQNASEQNAIVFDKMRISATNITGVMSKTTGIFQDNNGTVHKISSDFSLMSERFSDMAARTSQLAELISIMEGTVSSFSSV